MALFQHLSMRCAPYDVQFTLADFGQNTRSSTSKAEAAAYVELKDSDGVSHFVQVDTSITEAPIKAIISALNRLTAAATPDTGFSGHRICLPRFTDFVSNLIWRIPMRRTVINSHL